MMIDRAVVDAWTRTFCFVLLLALTGAAGWAAAAASPPGDALETVTLQLKWQHQFQFAGYYAALAQGYYREAGLNVRIVPSKEGANPNSVVLDGQADFGIGTSELLVLRGVGKPVVVLASIFQHSPFVFIVNAKAGIENVHGLAGKKISIEAQAAELLAYLKHEGIAKEQLHLFPHPFDPAPLIQGKLDAMSGYSPDEPFFLEEAGVPYKIFDPRAGGIDFYGDSLFTTEEQIRLHPQRVRAFLDASLKGWKYAFAHTGEIVDLIYNQYSQRHSREHLRFEAEETRKLVMPEIVELGYTNPGRWKYIADTYAELGLMAPDFKLDGFFYERNPRPRLARFYGTIAGLLALVLAAVFAALRYYKLNQTLKRQMDAQRRLSDSLRSAEERYRVLVEQAPFPIAISDPLTSAIRYLNPQAAQFFMVDQHQAVGQAVLQFYVNPQDRQNLVERVERQEQQEQQGDVEVELMRSNGQRFWTQLSASKIIYEGRPALFVAFNDITDRKAAEADRTKLITELQQALSQIKTLTGLIPICCSCKRIRADDGFWLQVESYIQEHTDAQFSHGICPECVEKLYP